MCIFYLRSSLSYKYEILLSIQEGIWAEIKRTKKLLNDSFGNPCGMMQSGKYNCGLFAVAFATALVHGQQPGKFMFDQQAMRKHLRLCLQNKVMPMFPIKKTRRVMAKVKSVDYIEIYCTCRMPPIPDVEMIECTKCKSWFHFPMCVSIPPEARKRGAQ